MKKQMLLSFLAGAVVPLVLAALFQKSPALPEAESESISPTQTAAAQDPATVLTVVNQAGNLQQMDLREYLVKKAFSVVYGARNLRRTIQKDLEDPISEAIIDSFETPISQISVRVEDGQILVDAQ